MDLSSAPARTMHVLRRWIAAATSNLRLKLAALVLALLAYAALHGRPAQPPGMQSWGGGAGALRCVPIGDGSWRVVPER